MDESAASEAIPLLAIAVLLGTGTVLRGTGPVPGTEVFLSTSTEKYCGGRSAMVLWAVGKFAPTKEYQMKIERKAVESTTTAKGGIMNETQKKHYFAAFFARVQFIVELGRAFVVDAVAAQHLIDGGAIELDSSYPINFQGKDYDLPLVPGQVIGLKSSDYDETLQHGWFCPSCNSAHGTAIGASKTASNTVPTVKGLLRNKWYYVPAEGRIITISDTCRDNWIDGTPHKSSVLTIAQYLRNPDARALEYSATTEQPTSAAEGATTEQPTSTVESTTTEPAAPAEQSTTTKRRRGGVTIADSLAAIDRIMKE